jgi:hypothetical protein
MNRTSSAVTVLFLIWGVARGNEPKPLDPKAVVQEIKKLEGAWGTVNKEPSQALPVLSASTVGLLGSPTGQGSLLAMSVLIPGRAPFHWNAWVYPFYRDGRMTGASFIASAKRTPNLFEMPALGISEQLRLGDFVHDGTRRFITLDNQVSKDDSPLAMLEYRFDGEALVFSISTGKLKGEHKLVRLTADAVALPVLGASSVGLMASPRGQGFLLAASALLPGRNQRVRTDYGKKYLDPEAVAADLKKLEGIWKTDAKEDVTFQLIVIRTGGVLVGAEVSGRIGPKPKDLFGEPVNSLNFWEDGERRGIFLLRPFEENPKMRGFEYRFDGETLVLVVTGGEAKREYRLKKVDGDE